MTQAEVLALRTEVGLDAYAAPSPYLDFDHPLVRDRVAAFDPGRSDETALVRRIFEWVRDDIAHSTDIGSRRVTVRASEVLLHREGICYAKAHLLGAMLRGAGIPAGMCYQRLTRGKDGSRGHVVHGLTTVYLASLGRWIRLDARGNRPGVDAQFSVDEEKLAWPIRPEHGEIDYRDNLPAPHPLVTATLEAHDDYRELLKALPNALPLARA
jgi:transglutaminase-like putative cysteine protease